MDPLESQNDESLDKLLGQVRTIRNITESLHEEVAEQCEEIEQMIPRVEKSVSRLTDLHARVEDAVEKLRSHLRSSVHPCVLCVLCVLCALVTSIYLY